MTSIRQLTFIAPGKFEWHEVPGPKLENDREAIVRPVAVTRCDLDYYIATGVFPMKGPFAFGHEIAGEVVTVGNAVTTVEPGDRVIVPFQISCGHCTMCARRRTNACLEVPAYSAFGLAPSSGKEWGGGLSDLVRVPYADAMLVKIPDELSWPGAAALSDNATDGFRTVAGPLEQYPAAEVLIVGGLAQSVGLFAVQSAIALGSRRVVYRDFDADRLAAAKKLGAEAIHTAYANDMPVDEKFAVVVEAAGLPDALTFALRSTMPCGICTGVSAGTGNMASVPLRSMYMQGITFEIGRVHARGELEAAMNCLTCSKHPVDAVVSRTVSFDDAGEAMAEASAKMVFIVEPSQT